MGTKKIAYTIEVGVPNTVVKQLIQDAQEYLDEHFDVQIKLKDHAQLLALIEKGIKKNLSFAIEDLYLDEVVDDSEMRKLFKKEIQEAEDKYEAERAAEEEAEQAKRIKTAGVLRMHPDQLMEAKKLLKAAGIDVTT